jgi:hypothetical protein
MPAVGQERQAPGRQAADELQRHDPGGDQESDQQPLPVPGVVRAVDVVVMVAMVTVRMLVRMPAGMVVRMVVIMVMRMVVRMLMRMVVRIIVHMVVHMMVCMVKGMIIRMLVYILVFALMCLFVRTFVHMLARMFKRMFAHLFVRETVLPGMIEAHIAAIRRLLLSVTVRRTRLIAPTTTVPAVHAPRCRHMAPPRLVMLCMLNRLVQQGDDVIVIARIIERGPFPAVFHQSKVAQKTELMRHCGLRQRQDLGNPGNRAFPGGQDGQDLDARRIGQCLENERRLFDGFLRQQFVVQRIHAGALLRMRVCKLQSTRCTCP